MAITYNLIVGLAIAYTVLTVQFAPQFSVKRSYIWTATVVYAVEFFLWTIWKSIIYIHFFSPLRHLPGPKGGSVLFGQFARILNEPSGQPQCEWIAEVPNDGLIKYHHLFNSERILLTSPKAIAEVLVHKSYEFIKPPAIRRTLGRILGDGLLVSEGDLHKRQRKMLMPAFAFRHIKDLYQVFWSKSREAADKMVEEIRTSSTGEKSNEGVVEIAAWASRATLDIIGIAGFGQDLGAIYDPNNELCLSYRKVFSPGKIGRLLGVAGNFIPIWVLRALPVKRNTELQDAAKTIRKKSLELVRAKKQKLEKGNREDYDILSVAMESGGFDEDDLVNQMMTFLAAGHETTASAMTWAAYELCKRPEIQTRLREEVLSGLPQINEPNSKVSSTDIDRLPYLSAFTNEIFRFHPPVTLTIRQSAQDTTICGHFIPAGTTVFAAPWAINTSKELWGDDADIFNPDRWLGPGRANTGGAESNYAFMTFIAGPRSCIGKEFSKAEFMCLLAAWVARFDFTLADTGYVLDVSGGATSKPKDLMVRLKVRDE